MMMQSNLTISSGTFQVEKEFSRFAVFDRTSQAIHAYDPNKDTWTELHKMATEMDRLDLSAIVVNEDIFVFAHNGRNWKLRYTDKNATWSPLPIRPITIFVVAVEVDGLIYAFDETFKDGKTVEVYDGSKWTHVTDKPVAGLQTYIVAVDDSIYCIGGHVVDSGYQSHCNKYETRKKCWSTLPPMPETRSCGSAAKLGRKIYIVGGLDFRNEDCISLSSALVFDIETEVWIKVASMAKPRYHFRAVAVAGKIYSIGDYDLDDDACDAVEEFDPVTGKWRAVTSLSGKEIYLTASIAL